MIGLHIRYEPAVGKTTTTKITSYRFEGGRGVKAHSKDAGEGRVFLLKCKCGSNDWTDNGRMMHEYECNGCGQFVEAYIS